MNEEDTSDANIVVASVKCLQHWFMNIVFIQNGLVLWVGWFSVLLGLRELISFQGCAADWFSGWIGVQDFGLLFRVDGLVFITLF